MRRLVSVSYTHLKYDLQTADQLAIVAGEQPSGEPFYAWGDPCLLYTSRCV